MITRQYNFNCNISKDDKYDIRYFDIKNWQWILNRKSVQYSVTLLNRKSCLADSIQRPPNFFLLISKNTHAHDLQ